MTEDTQEQEIVFTDEQQKFIDKLVGNARVKAREKASADAKVSQEAADQEAEREQLAATAEWEKLAKHHKDRVVELEPFEAEAKAYRELVTNMLKDRIKALGDTAKKAVAALPESLTDLEKLDWLNKNQALFITEGTAKVGTPAARSKASTLTDKGREAHRPLRL